MAVKQTAGRNQLGQFAPKFAELMMIFCLVRFGQERINYPYVTAP